MEKDKFKLKKKKKIQIYIYWENKMKNKKIGWVRMNIYDDGYWFDDVY